jgi:hypothetical protein
MRIPHVSPFFAVALVALSLGTAACAAEPGQESAAAAEKRDSVQLDREADLTERVLLAKKTSADSLAAERVHFAASDTLRLTLGELREGRNVLIRNPTGVRSMGVMIEDHAETHPLSRVLKASDTLISPRGGTRGRPGITLLKLSAVDPAAAVPEGRYEGRLVVADTGNLRAEREIVLAVPAPLPKRADTAWTSALYKISVAPPLRARVFENAEGRCARDTRDREGFAASRFAAAFRQVVGTCARDNIIPLVGARTRGSSTRSAAQDSAVASKRDSAGMITPRRVQTLLGVLRSEKGDDQGLVWWTGDSLSVGGARQGIELQFTSFDHPGRYYGKVDLAGAGAEGIVGLHVRVTHDWPLALLVIALGVYLSWWLRNYVRTRRAVLRMQETAADLASRIQLVHEQLQAVDSEDTGYQAYPVDKSLLAGLRQLERELQLHAYDGTVLEPGKEPHDTLRKRLEQAEQDVAVWEGFASVLGELRLGIATAQELEEQLPPENAPALLAALEALFHGDTLVTADVPPRDHQATVAEDAIRCWNEVAQAAVTLQTRLERATPEDKGRAAAAEALRAAVDVLWAAADGAAVKVAGAQVDAAGKLFRPKRHVLKMFGLGADDAAAAPPPPGAAPAAEEDEAPAPPAMDAMRMPSPVPVPAPVQDRVKGADSALSGGGFGALLPIESGAPFEPDATLEGTDAVEDEERAPRDYAALRARREKEEKQRKMAQAARDRAESRRAWSDRWYFTLTLVVAAATGLNQLYFDASGFGDMKDYMVALLWGFGTKMGLDTVRTAVESGRIPFLRDGAAQSSTTTTQNQLTGAQQTGAQQTGAQQAGAQQTGAQETAGQQNGAGANAGANGAQQPPRRPTPEEVAAADG